MKTKTLTITTGFHDPKLEEIISKKDNELKQQMRRNGRHFARSNRPLAVGDQLLPYCGEAKAGYEQLIAYIYQYLQPDSHLPNAKIDEIQLSSKVQTIDADIVQKTATSSNMENELNGYDPGSVPIRMWVIGIITLLIMIGETVFNTSAFDEWGDSFIFAVILSVGLSVGVFAFAHLSGHIYKQQATKLRMFLCILGSMFTVGTVFSTLAILRTQHLADREIESNPMDFMSINLFLFTVSLLLSALGLPEWSEIKEHLAKARTLRRINKSEKEVSNLKSEKGGALTTYTEATKDRITLGNYAKDSINRVRALYLEAVEIFKSTCLANRTDNKTPDCFYGAIPALDVPDYQFSFNLETKES